VERILSVSACGSLQEELAPGSVVIPDQLFDNTKGRDRTFFGGGLVAHLSAAEPFCPEVSKNLGAAVLAAGETVHAGGAFITIEGPRFSTRGESRVYRSWGMSIIGMTTAPEAFLAREAEMCYAVMAHVTDYDVWRESVEPVTVKAVVRTLEKNTRLARQAIRNLLARVEGERTCACASALSGAIITRPEAIPKDVVDRLGPLVSRYLGG
jgi:5'-methylthioadenosine phosphorylase